MFEPLPFSPQAMCMHLYAVGCRCDALTIRPALEALQLLYSLLPHVTKTRHRLPAAILRLRCRQYWLHEEWRSTAGNIRHCATPVYSFRMFVLRRKELGLCHHRHIHLARSRFSTNRRIFMKLGKICSW